MRSKRSVKITNQEKIIKNKQGLLNLSDQLGNVRQARQVQGHSRGSFYRFKELYNEQGSKAPNLSTAWKWTDHGG